MGARRAADYNAPGMAGVVFQNTALTRSLADRVVGFLTARLAARAQQPDQIRRIGVLIALSEKCSPEESARISALN